MKCLCLDNILHFHNVLTQISTQAAHVVTQWIYAWFLFLFKNINRTCSFDVILPIKRWLLFLATKNGKGLYYENSC